MQLQGKNRFLIPIDLFLIVNHRLFRFVTLLFTGLCLSGVYLSGQDFVYSIFDTENGLPSNEVYNIEFDQNRIIWAVTDRGVVRYDSHDFKVFTISEGLRTSTHLRLYRDLSGRVWSSSLDDELYTTVGDSLVESVFSEAFRRLPDAYEFIQQVVLTADSTLYVTYNTPGLFRMRPGESPEQLTDHLSDHEEASLCIRQLADGQLIWDMPRPVSRQTDQPTRVDTANGWLYLTTSVNDERNRYRKFAHVIGPGEFIISYANTLFHVKDFQLINEQRYDQDIYDVFVDHERSIWVSVEETGAYHYPSGDLSDTPRLYFKGERITGINQDHERNYWIATLDHGIYLVNHSKTRLYQSNLQTENDATIRSIHVHQDHLFFGSQSGNLYTLVRDPHENYHVEEVSIPDGKGPIRRIDSGPGSSLFLIRDNLFQIQPDGSLTGYRQIKTYPYALTPLASGEYLASFSYRLDLLRPIGDSTQYRFWDLEKRFPENPGLKNSIRAIRAMHTDPNGDLWLGTQLTGVILYQNSTPIYLSQKDTLLGRRTNAIIALGSRHVISVNDYGLILVNEDLSVSRINKSTTGGAMESDIVDALYAENDSTLWVGTGAGVYRMSVNPASGQVTHIDPFTMREGMPSNRTYGIVGYDRKIWIATNQGVVELDPFDRSGYLPEPILVIDQLIANDKRLPIKESYPLEWNQNSLVIRYKPISYQKPFNLTYRYRLEGLEEEWIYSKNLEVRYPRLNHGTYTFAVEASYDPGYGVWTRESVDISIDKPWWLTIFMICIYALAGFFIIYLGFRWFMRDLKKREIIKQRLLMAEKKALVSQMNPHFIFNSLNSIQHFILENDDFQANNYLTSFSSLIRRTLDNSKRNTITLQEEIEMLNLYLALEKLRFEEQFRFEIKQDPALDYHEIMIPPMLIQPLVENAIRHGLTPLESEGFLTIEFRRNDPVYRCVIEDNGIGREASKRLNGNNNHHKSTGLQNVQERIELLNRIHGKAIHLIIEDLKLPDGSPAGTRITLEIPLLWK